MEFLDIQATIGFEFTLKRVRDMTRTISQFSIMLGNSSLDKQLRLDLLLWFDILNLDL